MTTITGATAVIGSESHAGIVHRVEIDGVAYSAKHLASDDFVGPLSNAASAAVLECLECGSGPFSANDLYRDTPIPGECLSCASSFLAETHGHIHVDERCCA